MRGKRPLGSGTSAATSPLAASSLETSSGSFGGCGGLWREARVAVGRRLGLLLASCWPPEKSLWLGPPPRTFILLRGVRGGGAGARSLPPAPL